MAVISIRDTFVRFFGIKRGRFVEFEFGIADPDFEFGVADPDLVVELVLPVELLADFIRRQGARVIPCDAELSAEIAELCWQFGATDLLSLMPWFTPEAGRVPEAAGAEVKPHEGG